MQLSVGVGYSPPSHSTHSKNAHKIYHQTKVSHSSSKSSSKTSSTHHKDTVHISQQAKTLHNNSKAKTTEKDSSHKDSQHPIAKTVASGILDLVPVVGSVKSLIETVSGKDLVTGNKTSRPLAAMGMIPEIGAIGKVAKDVKNISEIEDAVKTARSIEHVKGKAHVPYKKDAGKAHANYVNEHSLKHIHNESTKSTTKKTQYGKHVDVKKLVNDTKKHPDSIEHQYKDPANGEKGVTIYKKEYKGNISTKDTPTGSHRVMENHDKPSKSTHFPYVNK